MKYKGDTTDAARPTIWLCMLCRRYFICIRNICLMYTKTYSEYFLYKWRTRLQSMYNHMVWRTASVISPFYSLLPGSVVPGRERGSNLVLVIMENNYFLSLSPFCIFKQTLRHWALSNDTYGLVRRRYVSVMVL